MSRLPPDAYTYPWGDAESCPCGSTRSFADCCKGPPRRLPYVEVPSLIPSLPQTGHANPKCYMAGTLDCSQKISREHYISAAILKELTAINVSGFPWHKDDTPVNYAVANLTANILCSRHNSALSPLDDLAVHAFRAFVDAPRFVIDRTTPGRPAHYLVSGQALELWMIKLLAGIFHAGIASADGEQLRRTSDMDRAELARVLSGGKLQDGAGMYVAQGPGTIPRQAIGAQPYTDVDAQKVVGLRLNFGTIMFEAFLSPPPQEGVDRMIKARRYRPAVIDFNGPARDARIVLTWPNQGNSIDRLGLEIVKS